MTNDGYERQLRYLDFADYHWRAVRALLRYKDDKMIDFNKARFSGDIDLVISTLAELKAEFGL